LVSLTRRAGKVPEFSTFWIKIGLYSLPDRGERQKADEEEGDCGEWETDAVRAMFITWVTLIAAGVLLYSVVGLTHH